MRKLAFLISVFLMLVASTSWAAWTITPSSVGKAGHYFMWKVVCTSDGSSLSATDLVALMPASLKEMVQGSTMMIMKVSPGSGSVAPDTTIDITLSDAQGAAIFTHTGYSNTADTVGVDLSEDYGQYFTVFDLFYLTISDIGSSGDQVTLYFLCWVEDKK